MQKICKNYVKYAVYANCGTNMQNPQDDMLAGSTKVQPYERHLAQNTIDWQYYGPRFCWNV